MSSLPVVNIQGASYFKDDRLSEYRSVDNPHVSVSFWMMSCIEFARKELARKGWESPSRVNKLAECLARLSPDRRVSLRLVECEKGSRAESLGKEKAKAGKCMKLGAKRSDGKSCQLWAVWA